jgi:hypothetical protein
MPVINTPEGLVNFPDSMSDSEIKKVLRKKFPPKAKKEPTTGDYARAAAQGLTFGFADEIEAAIRSAVGSKTYEEEVKGIRGDIERFREAAPVAAYGTEIGASALLPFGAARAGALGAKAAASAAARPVTAAVGTGALYGAGAAEEGERLKSAAIGGALGGAVGGAVSKALPKIAPEAKEMIRRGVPLTAGQAMGGAPRAFESTARALPFAGGVVEAAQQRATAQFSRTAVEDALKPLGLTLPKGVTGTQAVKKAFKKIDDAYDDLTPRLKIASDTGADAMRAAVTNSVREGIQSVGLISKKQQKDIDKYLNDIIEIFEGDEIGGKTILSADKILGKKAYQLTKPSASDSDRVVGEVLRTVQRGIRDELKTQNPTARADLRKIHKSYERLMPVQSAAAKARAAREGGEFTPAELISSAVSQRRRAGAKGEAPMQAEGLIGQGILGQDRTGISRPILEARPILGLLGGGALGATGALAPAAAGLGLLAGAYSRAGVPVTRAALSGLGTGLRAPVPMTAGLLGAEFSQ